MARTHPAASTGYEPDYPLLTKRLVLRPIVATDAVAMHAYKSDPATVRYVPYGPLDVADIEERIATIWSNTHFAGEGDAVCLAVEDRDSGTLLGDVVLF